MASSMKKQAIDYSAIACSYHEATHTCIALYNHIFVPDVSIRIDGSDAVGLTSFYLYKNGDILDQELKAMIIIAEIEMTYAGMIGEAVYYKETCGSDIFPRHLKSGSSEDIKNAQDLIRLNTLALPGKDTAALKKQIKKRVEGLIIENWASIKLLAHAIYKRKKLTYHDLKNLLCRKNPFWKERFKETSLIHSDMKVPEEAEVKQILTKQTA
jgi:hypothetical protein